MAWTPWGDVDLIPGINVGNAFKQAGNSTVGKALGHKQKDYDVIKGVSFKGGTRSPQGVNDVFGATGSSGVSGSWTPDAPQAPTNTVGDNANADAAGQMLAGGAPDAQAVQAAKDAALRDQLKNEIKGHSGEIDSLYNTLFGSLDQLLKARDSDLEHQYGDQFKKAGDQYASAIPEIETSYAAIGSGDSTDNSDAKDKAKFGYDDTVKTIGTNKKSDEAKIAQYGAEQHAKIQEDRDSARRNVNRVDETDDVDALRSFRNGLEDNLSNARVTKATLGTDGEASKSLEKLTGDNGRFKEATNALDSIIKSSMSGDVKKAAVKAITDNAGLSEEEKKKVDQQYGNVYAEQAAL